MFNLEYCLKTPKILGTRLYFHWSTILIALYFACIQNFLAFCITYISVILHEYGHSLAAKFLKIKTSFILMLPIGGMAAIEKIKPGKNEFIITIAGPLVNLFLSIYGIIGLLLFTPFDGFWGEISKNLTSNDLTLVRFFSLIVFVNLILAIFNLLPIFPMDGGRILRSLAVMMNISVKKATKLSVIISYAGCGVLLFFSFITGSILMMITVAYLMWAANAEYKQLNIKKV